MESDFDLFLSRVVAGRNFSAWLKDFLDNDQADLAAARANKGLLYDYGKDYVRDLGVEYNDELKIFDFMVKRPVGAFLSGLPVAVYHGTRSALLPSIFESGGLRPPRSRSGMASPHRNSGAGPRRTSRSSRGSFWVRILMPSRIRLTRTVRVLSLKTSR